MIHASLLLSILAIPCAPQVEGARGHAALAILVQGNSGEFTQLDVSPSPTLQRATVSAAASPTATLTGAQPRTALAGTSFGKVCEIAIDADFELYTALGSDVAATVAFVESVIHDLDVIFERDVNITLELTTVVVRTSPSDPYTSSDANTLLNQMTTEWSGGVLASVQRDVAHLMTGRNLNGAAISLAFIDGICDPVLGYAIGQTLWSADPALRAWVHAFALGTNFGAPTCSGPDCRIMCSTAGGCAGDVTSFGAASAAVIQANAAALPCLRDLTPPLMPPVFESFATGQVDESIWVSNPVAGLSDQAVQPPSAPYAALLTAAGPDDGLDDRWITNKILLGSALRGAVAYQVQHRGVPIGGLLHVEFADAAGAWSTLETVISDGSNQTVFSPRSIPLPPAALHDALQLRFTAEVDGSSEQWFVDDLQVFASAQLYCVAAPNSVSASGANLILGSGSSTSVSANDFSVLATSCPPGSFGIYIYAEDREQLPLGNGFLCVNGTRIFRAAVVQADVFGVSMFTLDQTALPPGSMIAPGDTLRFQLWYRDSVGAGFNLTNGLEATFIP